MKEHIVELFKFSRELTGDGFNQALDYIDTFIPLKIHKWKPKEKIWTWIVPENGLQIGEHTLEGNSSDTIILPIHLDHPRMANDNLSGVVVAMKLIDLLFNYKRKYSYTFLFLPETIGTIAWLSRYGTDYKYGIVIDSVGTDGEIVTTKTKTSSLLNCYIEGKTNEFFSNEHLMTGNDERALESVNIPSIQISRLPFKEYHTENDTPDIIQEDKLKETLDYVYSLILRIEKDCIPKPRYEGVPCLSANGLWEKDYETPETFIKIEKIWHLIGTLSIAQIAQIASVPFDFVYDFIKKLESKGLVWTGRT